MITVAQALDRIIALMQPVSIETVPLSEAAGRILARDVYARRDQPPFAASAMDGYAVLNSEAVPGAVLHVIGESQAGKRFDGTLHPGQAVRIFTGAPVPEGADAILIQEDADRTGAEITVHETRDPAPYLRAAGADFVEGSPLTSPRFLRSQDIALLAAMNIAAVPVRRKPVIAVIPTGNELVVPGETPGPDHILSSNNYGLKALLEACGAEVRLLPIARDTVQSLTAVFALTGGADLIVTLGGASVGDHDLVQQVAAGQGLELDFYKVAMRPGKPLMAGMMAGVPMVGLPGNPVSAMVCGNIFLRPALNALLGLPAEPLPSFPAKLIAPLGANGPREHYMRAHVTRGDDGLSCQVFERQDSALLSVLGASNALVVRAVNSGPLNTGELVRVILLDH